MRVTTGLFLLCALLFAACQSDGGARRSRAPASEAAPAPAGVASDNPLRGAFFHDGGDGDVRGRTENYFDGIESIQGGFDDFGPLPRRVEASTAAPAPTPAAERMLIQTGAVHVEVARPEEVLASFRTQVEAWGGHLQSQADRTLVVRVPAVRFDEAFQWVKDTGRVLSETRRAQDVTEEYVDLGIRLENARRSRERLLEILQQASDVEDILKVETELRRLSEEIERMEGRVKFLADQVALATLSATFESVAEPPPAKRRRRPSRFDWINRVGAERVLEDF